jgi:hypothetical protein
VYTVSLHCYRCVYHVLALTVLCVKKHKDAGEVRADDIRPYTCTRKSKSKSNQMVSRCIYSAIAGVGADIIRP